MAFETFSKSGKRSKMRSKPDQYSDKSYKLDTMYNAVDFGANHPDPSRRFTNNYGKTSGKRGDVDLEEGMRSRRTGRMFSWLNGNSY